MVIAGTRGLARPAGPYYAGRGNHFWTLLHASGLVTERLGPEDAAVLPELGIGLTDVVIERRATAGREPDVVVHSVAFARAMGRQPPAVVAFVSKSAAGWYARGAGEPAPRGYGSLPWTVAGRPAFVLPGPSGANNAMSLPLRIAMWGELGDFLLEVGSGGAGRR